MSPLDGHNNVVILPVREPFQPRSNSFASTIPCERDVDINKQTTLAEESLARADRDKEMLIRQAQNHSFFIQLSPARASYTLLMWNRNLENIRSAARPHNVLASIDDREDGAWLIMAPRDSGRSN